MCKCYPQNTLSRPRSGCVLMPHITSPEVYLHCFLYAQSHDDTLLICFFPRSRRRERGGYTLGEGEIKLNSHRSCWLSISYGCLFTFPPVPWMTVMLFPSFYGEISWSAQYFKGLGRSYLNKGEEGWANMLPRQDAWEGAVNDHIS